MKLVVDHKKMTSVANAFARLPQEVYTGDMVMKSFRKASKIMLAAGKTNLSSRASGLYMAGAGESMKARQDKTGTILRVGMINNPRTKGTLGHLFDAGSGDRTVLSTGQKVGKHPKTNWWRDAVSSTEKQVEDKAAKEIINEVDKYLKKS